MTDIEWIHPQFLTPPWITTLHFCPMESPSAGAVLLGSHAGGVRGPASAQEWWPQIVGQPVDNLGNILLVDRLPTIVHLGIYLVAYGVGHESLRISIGSDKDPSMPMLEQETQVSFTPAPQDETPGIAALRLAVRDCQIGSAGLYWFSAAIGGGSATRIPLSIQERGAWSGHVDLDTILRHRATQRDNQPA